MYDPALTAEIKAWHRNKLLIDIDTIYMQGIVTMTRVGTKYRIAWKCDDATYKIGTDRRLWHGHDSFGTPETADTAFRTMVECMRGYGLEPEEVR